MRCIAWAVFSEQEFTELTSKKFEKKIYEDYKMFDNARIDARTRKLNATGRTLARELGVLGAT